MAITTIDELFEHHLKEVYGAEQRVLEALDEMANETVDREAKKGFQQHRKDTQGQIKRLERVFKSLDLRPEPLPCAGIEGLIKERKSLSKEKPSEEILSFADLHAAQKVERYEITAYEGLIETAQQLGLEDAVEQLTQNLEEEEQMLNNLKTLASEYNVEESDEESEAESEERETSVVRGRR
jgi:ferritin-like metal-binding protein YciE